MNWDFVERTAKHEAHKYALQGGVHSEGSEKYALRFSGFLAGYMQNAGERESLRIILKRCEDQQKKATAPTLEDLV